MAKTSDKVIRVAKAEIGYLEKRSNKNLNSKQGNAGSLNYTKYGKWYGLTPAYWCAEFVSWCFNKAYGNCNLIYDASASCEVIRQRFIKNKRYHSDAKAGDCIFFKGSRHAGANHIGIVTKVSGNTIYTVEGNTSSDAGVVDNGGAVNNKAYLKSYSRILGFGRPAYDHVKKTYSGAFPALPKRGYFKIGDKGDEVKKLQRFLIWYGLSVGKSGADGDYGKNTYNAVLNFKKLSGLTQNDGNFGKNCLKKAKASKK